MKTTSVIFLILSLVLIIAGTTVCLVTQSMAQNSGVNLFAHGFDANNNGVYTEQLSDSTVNKIVVRAKNADVIIKSGESSSITLKNYSIGSYYMAVSNKNLTFEEGVGLMSLFKFSSGSFSFNGLRQFLNFDGFKGKNKAVEIVVGKDETLKHIEIEIENGNVNIEGNTVTADYFVTIKNGKAVVDVPGKFSTVKVNIDKGDLTFKTHGNNGKFNAVINEGNAYLILGESTTRAYSLKTENGSVTHFGSLMGNSFESSPVGETSTEYSVNVASGNISVELHALSN